MSDSTREEPFCSTRGIGAETDLVVAWWVNWGGVAWIDRYLSLMVETRDSWKTGAPSSSSRAAGSFVFNGVTFCFLVFIGFWFLATAFSWGVYSIGAPGSKDRLNGDNNDIGSLSLGIDEESPLFFWAANWGTSPAAEPLELETSLDCKRTDEELVSVFPPWLLDGVVTNTWTLSLLSFRSSVIWA